jgi:hypothetical protein
MKFVSVTTKIVTVPEGTERTFIIALMIEEDPVQWAINVPDDSDIASYILIKSYMGDYTDLVVDIDDTLVEV